MNFFLTVITIYLIFYLYIRFWSWRLLREAPRFRRNVLIFMDLSTLVLPLSYLARQYLPAWLTGILQVYGYCWAAIIACLIPWALLAEPIRFVLKKFKPGFVLCSGIKVFAVVIIMSFLTLSGGLINARLPRVQELELELPSNNDQQKYLTIAAFSDLHAGNLVSRSWVADIVEKVNALSPDIILLMGDILGDRELETNGTLKELAKLKAPLGKFAVLGNHEYYLDDDHWSTRILESTGITVLEDEAVLLADSFVLAGRQDYTVQRRGGHRLSLKEILSAQPLLPVILMDHNPKNLAEAAESKVALQLSGHTHNGQLFPFNFFIDMMYEKGWGEYSKGNTRYYISCGVGIWGPPLRTSSVPEILRIKIRFRPSKAYHETGGKR